MNERGLTGRPYRVLSDPDGRGSREDLVDLVMVLWWPLLVAVGLLRGENGMVGPGSELDVLWDQDILCRRRRRCGVLHWWGDLNGVGGQDAEGLGMRFRVRGGRGKRGSNISADDTGGWVAAEGSWCWPAWMAGGDTAQEYLDRLVGDFRRGMRG